MWCDLVLSLGWEVVKSCGTSSKLPPLSDFPSRVWNGMQQVRFDHQTVWMHLCGSVQTQVTVQHYISLHLPGGSLHKSTLYVQRLWTSSTVAFLADCSLLCFSVFSCSGFSLCKLTTLYLAAFLVRIHC